jgi:hypothetical protein
VEVGSHGELGQEVRAAERREADTRRDRIAQAMWAQYKATLQERSM